MRPAPFMPPDVDLRDFTFMPVDIVRLFGSDFHARSSDAEWRAGMTLWLKSFHQVPAGSVPAGDVALARLAEFGRDLHGWQAVQEGALHGWTLCDDDRWYHKVVCEKALEGWIGKLLQRRSGAVGNGKRWGTSADLSNIDRQIAEAAKALQKLAPGSIILRKCKPSQSGNQSAASAPDGANEPLSSRPDHDPMAPPLVPDRDPIAEGSQEKTITNRKESVSRAHAREDTPTPASDKGAKPAKRGRKSNPETTWPEDLTFGEQDRAYATRHGFAGQSGERLFEKFEAKAKAKGWTYKDWHAAFRTFVLNEHPPPSWANGARSHGPPDV